MGFSLDNSKDREHSYFWLLGWWSGVDMIDGTRRVLH
jgi:hypothetical protein